MKEKDENFGERVIPAFPVPNIVFFPNTRLPLHIHEKRYIKMVKDVLSKDKLIAMFLLKGGESEGYREYPEFYQIGCAGKIVAFSELQDGRYNIVLSGVFKVKVLEIIKGDEYQKVKVKVIKDSLPPENVQRILKKELLESSEMFLNFIGEKQENIKNIITIGSLMPFEEAMNWACTLVVAGVREKQKLLEINAVQERCISVMKVMNETITHLRILDFFKHLRPSDPSLN